MASKRMVRREQKRMKAQRVDKRAALVAKMKDPSLDLEVKFEVLEQLEKMPRDSSAVRLTRRCVRTGRARGVLRKFKLCRNELRRRAMEGEVPGLVKSSW